MKNNPVLVLGGVFAFGLTLVWGQGVFAYGPQWRPAQMAPAAHMRSAAQPRIANMPSFRPSAAFTRAQPAYSRWSRSQPRYFRPRAQPRRYVDWRDSRDQRQIKPPQFAHAPSQRYMPPLGLRPYSVMGPTWAGPLATVPMPTWQHGYVGSPPMPGSFPTRVPVAAAPAWDAQAVPRYRQDRWAIERAPTAVVVPPFGPSPAMSSGVWRPVPGVAPTIGYRGQSAAGPDRFGVAPAWRHEPTARVMPGSAATPRGPHPSWRPTRAVVPQPGLAARDFRPVVAPVSAARAGYGNRSLPNSSAPSQRHALPGWATTYDQALTAAVCDWCNGS